MLKRFYLQISSLMILGTVVLLVCFGGFVYLELNHQLRMEGDMSLRSEFVEVHERVVTAPRISEDIFRLLDTSDDKGLSLYTLIHTPHGNYVSEHTPVAPSTLLTHTSNGHFTNMLYNNQHYRIFSDTFVKSGVPVQIVTFESTQQVYVTLKHVRNLLFLVGTVGVVGAILFHLWIARKALIPAQKTWQAHQEMLVELSHELQTPLATMNAIVSTHVAEKEIQEDLSREILEASTLVKDILYLSRLNAKSFQVHLQPVAVSDLTDEVIERFRPLLQQRNIHLSGFSQPGLFLMSTPEMWTRLISTLCKNVVDHAEEDTEATWSLTAESHMIQFRLKNRAQTMPTAVHPPRDMTRGFGMKIANRIVEEMQGRIDVRMDGPWVITTVVVPQKIKL
ncbi:sensor histidine kinase [Alicyclobacillus pomorum]|uniref:sensor histidine kinase n=1 Tax=Alicyclobacillus pomorum TaxID=204470 RepID=UPI00042219BD|nr:HAMP domain-containing sensor histidine kinase [Alicyclobacillus pomorum]